MKHKVVINKRKKLAMLFPVVLTSSIVSFSVMAQQSTEQSGELEEITVTAKKKIYTNQAITEAMKNQQNPISSVLAMVDNLPGVNITEGDAFGFDDWSTTINLRGFQNSLSEQQVGITIDGLPNGESNYGGGSKANRYIDSANLQGVDVSQGTADIGSRSIEALGGTLNFITRDPLDESRFTLSVSAGDYDSRRYSASYDTGLIFADTTVAYISASHQHANDWVDEFAKSERDHFALKFISTFDTFSLTGYLSADDADERNYQRITLSEFNENPNTDRLTAGWTGIPYVDQVYRPAWGTLRENYFGYLKLDTQISDNLEFKASIYAHDNSGRGDWVPPYIADVTNDGNGAHSELSDRPSVLGGPILGSIYFVDAQGRGLTAKEGCISSITQPYGGASAQYDPACYPAGAIGVQSYRHTHYKKQRTGLTADFTYDHQLAGHENQIRGGVWYEDQTRDESRDWHRLLDTRVPGAAFAQTPYFVQYDREYPREVLNYYLEDNIQIGSVTATFGIRQFFIDIERNDRFNSANHSSLNSDSDVLMAAGLNWETPLQGVEMYAGYSENYKALSDLLLERDAVNGSDIEPETSNNMEVGVRFEFDKVSGSAAYFSNKFENRLEFFGPQQAGNIPSYSIGTDGRYDNVGGIETDGFELSATYLLSDTWSLYGAYTHIDATYVGTGLGASADQALGIFSDNKVVNTPESSLVISLDWTNEVYRAGVSGKYVDDRYLDRANTLVAEGYTTVDLFAGYNASELIDGLDNLDINLVLNNLFDESYIGGISDFGGWIGAPRSAVISFTASF